MGNESETFLGRSEAFWEKAVRRFAIGVYVASLCVSIGGYEFWKGSAGEAYDKAQAAYVSGDTNAGNTLIAQAGSDSERGDVALPLVVGLVGGLAIMSRRRFSNAPAADAEALEE